MNRRERRKKAVSDFCKGFLIAMVFLVPLYTGAVLFSSLGETMLPQRAEEEEQVAPVSEPAPRVPVSTAKSYSLLCTLQSDNGMLVSAFLLRFDTEQYRIALCDLPAMTVALADKSPKTLRELHATRGAQGVRDAVQETLGVVIDGYIGMDAAALRSIVNGLGEFSCTLPADVAVYDAQGIMIYSKHAGTTQMNGNDVVMVLQYNSLIETERSRLNELILQSTLGGCADEELSGKLHDLYQRNVNSLDTDVSPSGLVRLTKAVEAVCAESGAQLEPVRLEGSYSEGRFELNEGAQERFSLYFSR